MQVDMVDVVLTDLVSELQPRLNGMVDLLVGVRRPRCVVQSQPVSCYSSPIWSTNSDLLTQRTFSIENANAAFWGV